ncbi:MAG: hypothetical protein GXN93_01375 [Candidatus Diapherotrites archaeon]|nr:hypothetical protein [Candidatus Diapherotrites archaeon]
MPSTYAKIENGEVSDVHGTYAISDLLASQVYIPMYCNGAYFAKAAFPRVDINANDIVTFGPAFVGTGDEMSIPVEANVSNKTKFYVQARVNCGNSNPPIAVPPNKAKTVTVAKIYKKLSSVCSKATTETHCTVTIKGARGTIAKDGTIKYAVTPIMVQDSDANVLGYLYYEYSKLSNNGPYCNGEGCWNGKGPADINRIVALLSGPSTTNEWKGVMAITWDASKEFTPDMDVNVRYGGTLFGYVYAYKPKNDGGTPTVLVVSNVPLTAGTRTIYYPADVVALPKSISGSDFNYCWTEDGTSDEDHCVGLCYGEDKKYANVDKIIVVDASASGRVTSNWTPKDVWKAVTSETDNTVQLTDGETIQIPYVDLENKAHAPQVAQGTFFQYVAESKDTTNITPISSECTQNMGFAGADTNGVLTRMTGVRIWIYGTGIFQQMTSVPCGTIPLIQLNEVPGRISNTYILLANDNIYVPYAVSGNPYAQLLDIPNALKDYTRSSTSNICGNANAYYIHTNEIICDTNTMVCRISTITDTTQDAIKNKPGCAIVSDGAPDTADVGTVVLVKIGNGEYGHNAAYKCVQNGTTYTWKEAP